MTVIDNSLKLKSNELVVKYSLPEAYFCVLTASNMGTKRNLNVCV
jgi:hypothetical protein